MVLFNYSTKELTAKVVYYGPGLCGKTTNLQWIHEKTPIKNKGKMLSLATEADRTLFFDFLPIELGSIRGMKTRIQLYTVPGQVFYNATRRMVLKGADCVVFVADSQEPMLDATLDALRTPRHNLDANHTTACAPPERPPLAPPPGPPRRRAGRRGGDRSGAAGGDRRRGALAGLGRRGGDLALRRRGAVRDGADRHRPPHQGQEHAHSWWRRR